MPPKKVSGKKVSEGDSKRIGRHTRRNITKDRSSLAESSTPVGQRPQEVITKDVIQDNTPQDLSLIRENLVTTAAASTSNNC